MNPKPAFFIVANSPGEIYGWVKPVITGLKSAYASAVITVVLLPCSFASGTEADVLSKLEGVDAISLPSNFFKLLRTQPPPGSTLLHFGGDLMYSGMLLKKWKIPGYAYIWAKKTYDRYFSGYWVRHARERDRLVAWGISPAKIHIVGDLLVDDVMREAGDIQEESQLVGFMPGSRLREVKILLPFFLEMCEHLSARLPDLRYQIILSPFLPRPELNRILAHLTPDRHLGGISGTFNPDAQTLSTAKILARLVFDQPRQALAQSSFVVTIPGTKTGEAAALGKPMLVFVPLNRVDLIPFTGMAGLLDGIPVIGPKIKAWLIKPLAGKFGWISQPNILAQEAVVPEMLKELTPLEVAQQVEQVITSPERISVMRARLKELYAPFNGANRRLLETLNQGNKP